MLYLKSAQIMLGIWNIGILNEKGLEICDELWKRNVDLCCLQEVRWRGCGARLIGLQGWKYKLWWSGNQEGNCGVGVLVKEELHDKIIEIRITNERVMSLAIVFEEVVSYICHIRIVIYVYSPQSGKWTEEKAKFYEDLSREWTTHHTSELIITMGYLNGHVGRNIDHFLGFMQDLGKDAARTL